MKGILNNSPIRAILGLAGIDRAVGYYLVNRLWWVISYPVTLYLITTYFSEQVQGYYFTYITLLDLQSVMDMGFGVVMIQFISHEWAHLKFGEDGKVAGNTEHQSRLASLLRMGFRWYISAAGVFFTIAAIGGYFFFRRQDPSLGFLPSWIALCVTATFSFPLLFLRGILEGSNQMARSQSINLWGIMTASLAAWAAIVLGMDLFTPSIMNSSLFLVSVMLLGRALKPYWPLFKKEVSAVVSWHHEYWPQQWRIGLSWLSGFIMYKTFTPFIFTFHGPAEAGKMGLAVFLFLGVHSFSMSWVYPLGPQMGIMWARSDPYGLLELVKKTYVRCLAVAVLVSAVVLVFVMIIKKMDVPQSSRFPSIPSVALMLAASVVLQLAAIQTQAIRFRKQEPFLTISIATSALLLVSNFFLGKNYSVMGCSIGFFVINAFFQAPLIHYIFKREMRKALTGYSSSSYPSVENTQ